MGEAGGQTAFSWEDFVEYVTTQENVEDEGWNVFLQELEERHAQPQNINEATREDLERLLFLTAEQVEALLAYVYRYGGLQTLGELQLIKELDYDTRRFLPLFFYAAPIKKQTADERLKTLLKRGKHIFATQLDIPLYQRDGYKYYSDEEWLKNLNKKYLGNALYHSWRYRFVSGKKLYGGVTAEKDAGEPFGSYGNRPYDALSGYVVWNGVNRWLQTVALGDYRLSFGEGLVLGSGFLRGKDGNVWSFSGVADVRGIRPHTSTGECFFFRGAASTIRWGKVDITAFYSYRKHDATPCGQDSVSTLRTDGYHRTPTEVERKHNLTMQGVGGNVIWRPGAFYMGATAYRLHTSQYFVPGTALYRAYYPEGTDFWVAGTHYGWRGYRWAFSGETAYSNNHRGWATLNRANYRFSSRYRLTLVQRFYSYKYHSFFASAFGEESQVRNESGVFVGMETSPLDYLHVKGYVDFFYSPWPRYTMTRSSHGQEGFIEVQHPGGSRCRFTWSYRFRHKAKSDVYRYHNYLKGQMAMQFTQALEWNTVVLFHGMPAAATEKGSRGFACVQRLKGQWWGNRLRATLTEAYFHTDDYDSRLYFYEPDLPYVFYSPAYYGKGIRSALTLHGTWKMLCMSVKCGCTHYFDREEIGSGAQRIPHATKSDISLSLQAKF